MSNKSSFALKVKHHIRESFARQGGINTLNGEITHISLGLREMFE